jgi:hypothetical protein
MFLVLVLGPEGTPVRRPETRNNLSAEAMRRRILLLPGSHPLTDPLTHSHSPSGLKRHKAAHPHRSGYRKPTPQSGTAFFPPFSRGEKNLSGPRRSQAVPAGTKRYDRLLLRRWSAGLRPGVHIVRKRPVAATWSALVGFFDAKQSVKPIYSHLASVTLIS